MSTLTAFLKKFSLSRLVAGFFLGLMMLVAAGHYDSHDRASLPTHLLVATVSSNATDLIYPNPDAIEDSNPEIGMVGDRGKQLLLKDAKQIPAARQPVINPTENETLEKAGQAFKDASGFLKGTADAALERPEMQTNPALSQ
jgi:hypothetical protein